jgi:hypothetical protein
VTVGLVAALSLLALLGWAVCKVAAHADREEARRNMVGLVAEQVRDERAIADNLDV